MRKLGDRNTTKSVSIIEASRLLSKTNIKFREIEYHVWNTWKISFDSFQEANSAIRSRFLSELSLTLYTPKYKVYRKGVIKDVPCDILLNEIQSLEIDNPLLRITDIYIASLRITNIFRLKRKDPVTKKWIDSLRL